MNRIVAGCIACLLISCTAEESPSQTDLTPEVTPEPEVVETDTTAPAWPDGAELHGTAAVEPSSLLESTSSPERAVGNRQPGLLARSVARQREVG